jgi:cytochrome P450
MSSRRFEFDLCDPTLYSSGRHLAAFAQLRREAPVYEQAAPDGGRFWSVTRYDDLVRVARDHEHFSAGRRPDARAARRGHLRDGCADRRDHVHQRSARAHRAAHAR